MRMAQKRSLIILLCCVALLIVPQVAKAATITSASLDRDTYLAGQTGYVSVTIYNDESEKIRVIELSSTIDYYYTDGTIYIQNFFTNVTLPDEIPVGQSETYHIPISLPINIAAGYTNPKVDARTEIWYPQTERWLSTEPTTYHLNLYIESPYKQLYETTQQELESTEQQLQEQNVANQNLTNTTNLLTATTIVFASAAALAMFLSLRKPRPIPQA